MATPEPERHFLYAIEFTDRVVKVGRTYRLEDRLREHRKAARELGVSFLHLWYESGFTDGTARQAEAALIAHCKANWPRVQGLEFFDAPFDEVVKFAEELAEVATQRQPSRSAA